MFNYELEHIELQDIIPICTYEYHDLISSTSDRAKELVIAPLTKFPVLIVAANQTSGRGRGNKKWWSEKGCLMMSIGVELCSDYFPADRNFLPEVSPRVGRMLLEVLRKYIPPQDNINLKYPNDVYVNNKKIAGILIESPTPKTAVIGIGANINNPAKEAPPEIKQNITSLIDLTGKITNIQNIITEFITKFFDVKNLMKQ
ncbi:MAG: biotin--[acetyl-CoA-carboxylase] ligase [Planctomycetaceae bacterium]|jgi:BirA family biotin operon repressor/biotin-[acetyl-CoA-carboxylase] ligase|nr:biotin--[acetyl-CoA-carboxylase] ligase [Planctomycetaceae bacterium]